MQKNYLTEKELEPLNNLIEQYLVFATGQAKQRIPMYMEDWITKLNGFLTLNNREILEHAGRISHELAKEKAETEYKIYHTKRLDIQKQLDTDFEKTIKLINIKKPIIDYTADWQSHPIHFSHHIRKHSFRPPPSQSNKR